MKFSFVAFNDGNQVRRGILDATNPDQVEQILARDGFRLAVVKECPKSILQRLSLRENFPTLFPLKTRDIIGFSRALSVILTSGTTIIAALDMLKDQSDHPLMKNLIDQIEADLTAGRSLAFALSRHPKYFSNVYVRVVATAEETGSLDKALEDLSDYMEREAAIRRKIAQTLIYPAFTVVVGVVVIAILFTVTLPQLVTLFDAFSVDLPLPTRILIATVDFVDDFRFLLLGGLGLLIIAAVLLPRSRAGKRALHRVLLNTPLVNQMVIAADLGRFLHSLGRLLRAGSMLPDAVDLSAKTVTNVHIRDALDEARRELIQGRGLAAPLRDRPIFPRMLVHFIKVGEDSGTMDEAIGRMAVQYERELDERSKAFVSLIEPTLTIVLGAAVAFVALAIIMPIYTIIGEVGSATTS